MLFSIVTVSIYIPINGTRVFPFLSTYQWAAQGLGRKGQEAGLGPAIAEATKIGMSYSGTEMVWTEMVWT